MDRCRWFFDFISPFAYFQFVLHNAEFKRRGFILTPVLFAGLLKHWGHKGPAEIGDKRRFTYRFSQWYAISKNISFRMPPTHPFNPLVPLRLAIAAGNDYHSILTIFNFLWRDGRSLDDEESKGELVTSLNLDMADLNREDVKIALKENTEQAIESGVFGVPTTVVGRELFWGSDATDMLFDYLNNPEAFDTEEMQRVSDLPYGVHRKV